jgi:streptogramin lyase
MDFRSAIILLIGLLGASLKCAADTVDIREWLVPWEKSEPTDAWVGTRGRVWFVASEGDFIANFSQQTAEFNRYDLPRGTAPVALLPVPTRNSRP